MNIEALGEPNPGQTFNFTVRGGVGKVTIAAYINESQVVFQTECPDPPCHEMVFIPEYASGQLLVVATDSSGIRAQRVFNIKSLISGGGMVSSA
jgi:hypothetical protein